MSFNLRLFLVILHAAFVVAMGVQSALDTPHHYTPPGHQVLASAAGDEQTQTAGDLIQAADDESSASQHETETSVDHAMIGPGPLAGLPPLRAQTSLDLTADGLPGGRPAATIERPPRAVLAA